MKRLVLAGGGHAHALVLRALAKEPLLGARITVVAPNEKQVYSGMLPGILAGHYTLEQAQIDLAGLAERAYADFVKGSIVALDPERRRMVLGDGAELAYDFASLNVGSIVDHSIPGSGDALAVKPFEELVERLHLAECRSAAVIGAGAAGVEIAMALRHRGLPSVAIYSERPGFPAGLEARVFAALRRLGVNYIGMPVTELLPGSVVVAGGAEARYDLVLLATGAAAPWWLRDSGLATDERGFVLVDRHLASVSHPEVLAAGDCATLQDAPLPKSGVQSVRQGPLLERNLRSLVEGRGLASYRPRRDALQLISCGARYAIAQRGDWAAEGRWVWRWKDWIDRRWVAGFAPARAKRR